MSDPDALAILEVGPGSGVANVTTSDDLLSFPTGVTLDGEGDLLIADPDVPHFVGVDPGTGAQDLRLGAAGLAHPTGIAFVPETQRGWAILAGASALARFHRRPPLRAFARSRAAEPRRS